MQKEGKHIANFDRRESALLEQLKTIGVQLPEPLKNWPVWFGDSERYLHALKNFVEDSVRSHLKMSAAGQGQTGYYLPGNPFTVNDVFHTPKNMEELTNWCLKFKGQSCSAAIITTMMMTLNLAHKVVEEQSIK